MSAVSKMFMLDLLDNLPRLRLSDDHLKAIIWVMRECGTPNVPSFYALRKKQSQLTQDVNIKPQRRMSSLGNVFFMNHPKDLIALVCRIFKSPICYHSVINHTYLSGLCKSFRSATYGFIPRDCKWNIRDVASREASEGSSS